MSNQKARIGCLIFFFNIWLMQCHCHHWVSEWMTPHFSLLLAYALAWHFVNHTVAITVVMRSLPLPPMALVVSKAKAVITIIYCSLNVIIHTWTPRTNERRHCLAFCLVIWCRPSKQYNVVCLSRKKLSYSLLSKFSLPLGNINVKVEQSHLTMTKIAVF